jgi:phenylpyruvate tautomerase
MPYLKIETNFDIDDNSKQKILKTASKAVSEVLGKNEKYVMVAIEPKRPMIFGANQDPCVYMELKSIGLPKTKTAELSHGLCQLIHEKLGVPPNRVYIEFSDADRAMWGWNGSTF